MVIQAPPLLLRLWITCGLFRLAIWLGRLAVWISPEIDNAS